jgi:hypothetical protein
MADDEKKKEGTARVELTPEQKKKAQTARIDLSAARAYAEETTRIPGPDEGEESARIDVAGEGGDTERVDPQAETVEYSSEDRPATPPVAKPDAPKKSQTQRISLTTARPPEQAPASREGLKNETMRVQVEDIAKSEPPRWLPPRWSAPRAAPSDSN